MCGDTLALGTVAGGSLLLAHNRRPRTARSSLHGILPAFLGSLVAGAVVDHFGRARLLRLSHLARAFVGLAFWAGTALLPPSFAIWVICLANALAGLLTQFAAPSEMSLLPDLAGRERLLLANTLFQFSLLAAEGIGIVVLTPIATRLASTPTVGLAGAALCLLAFALVAPLTRETGTGAPTSSRWSGWSAFFADLKTGWQTIAGDRLLGVVAVQATLAAAMLLILVTLLPGMVARKLALSVENAPLAVLPAGIGFIAGVAFLNRLENRLSRQRWIAMGLIGVGLSAGLLGLLATADGPLGLLPFALLVVGVGLSIAWVVLPARAVLQERPPAELRGRVISAQLTLANAATAIPLLLGGALADQLGIGPVVGTVGLLALGAGLVALPLSRA